MRALMKGNAAQFFKKKQKQEEDPEVIINQIQAKLIAKQIGIDQQQINTYSGFFQQVAKIKLPKGFKRYPNVDKTRIVYVNQNTGDQDYVHPSIDIIKVAFYKFLSDTNSVSTFNTKSKKLLAFVQEKMIKQCIGLSSKRRQAEKTNLQRDQNGKIVMSKLARLKPDLKSLLSARSYMLKGLVDKIYTRKQLWGKGKKAAVYAAVLASQKGNRTQDEEQQIQQSEQTLQFYENIYIESKKFYENQFNNLTYIPEQFKKQKSFYRSTPQSVLKNLGILNIDKDRMELYWLARLMQCLPLPPGWSTKVGDSFDSFYYQPKKLTFDLHPSYIYVLEQMNNFKQAYIKMDIIHQNYYNNMKQMVFFDFFERPYSVDIFAFVQKMNLGTITKKKAIKKSEQLGKNDWMALDGYKNSYMAIQNVVLLQDILLYWKNLNYRQDNYMPAISPFGQVIWSSNINQRTINYCPHAEILNILMQQKSLQLQKIRQKDLKRYDQNIPKQADEMIIFGLNQQRQKFLKHYIRHDPKPLSQPYTVPDNYNEPQFFDSIFVSPFDLQSDLKLDESAQIPIWLQKFHAKKNTQIYIALLNKNPQKLQQFKNIFTKYSLQMIRKHEPNREQDILKVISQITTIKQFKKFIYHINDIDSRQQRKRLAAVGVVQQEEDSFGSSISQIQMGDKNNEQSSQDQLIDIQVQSESQQQKQKSIQSDEQIKIEVKSQSQKHISEVSKQSDTVIVQPQIYDGIIYNKNKEIENLSVYQLDNQIDKLRQSKILKHKYSILNFNQNIWKISKQLLNNSREDQDATNKRRNVLISRFNSEHAPYKVSPIKITHKDRKIQTANIINNISQQFSAFKSQTSLLGNQEIITYIKQCQAINLKKSQQTQNDKHPKNIDQTKQTISLLPIKRIKPDINDDPRLRHMSQISDIRDFKRAFINKDSPTKLKNMKKQIIQNVKKTNQQTNVTNKFNPDSTNFTSGSNKQMSKLKKMRNSYGKIQKFIQKMQSQEIGIDENLHTTHLKKSHSVLSFSNSSLSPNKWESKFNRICLGNTATSLLCTQPIIKKRDLIILQAKKSLISKGRGLETLISKKY